MKKARAGGNNFWDKKLLEVEEKDPNRWRHTGFKKMYIERESSSESEDFRSCNRARNSRSRSRNRKSPTKTRVSPSRRRPYSPSSGVRRLPGSVTSKSRAASSNILPRSKRPPSPPPKVIHY